MKAPAALALCALAALAPMGQASELSGRFESAEVLGKAIANIEDAIAQFGNVTCRQVVKRYAGKAGRENPADVVTMLVDNVSGVETYSDIRRLHGDGAGRPGRTYQSVRDLHGSWTYGEFFGVLRITAASLTSSAPIVAPRPDGATGTIGIFFHCSVRCWTIRARSRLYWMAIDGELQVDPETGALRELSWVSTGLPAESGVERVELKITYRQAVIAGQSRTVPGSSSYRVAYTRSSHADWNSTDFTDYRRFGSESSLSFEGQ